MKQKTKNTPLSMFPTEALLKEYRRHRYCFQKPVFNYYISYNTKSKKQQVWKRVLGEFEGYTICVSMERVLDKYPQDIIKEHTVIKSKQGGRHYEWVPEKHRYMTVNYGNLMKIHFGNMKWEGQMEEIKEELSKRENVNINGGKAYRKWLNQYNKSKR